MLVLASRGSSEPETSVLLRSAESRRESGAFLHNNVESSSVEAHEDRNEGSAKK